MTTSKTKTIITVILILITLTISLGKADTLITTTFMNIDTINPDTGTTIDLDGNTNVSQNLTGNLIFGEMWSHNDTTWFTVVIETQNVWTNFTINSTDSEHGTELNGFTYESEPGTLIAQVDGLYKADFSVSTGNAGQNQEYQFMVGINNVSQSSTDVHRKIGAAGDVGNAGTSGSIRINNGDRINLLVKNSDGTSDLRAHAVNLNLIRIGD